MTRQLKFSERAQRNSIRVVRSDTMLAPVRQAPALSSEVIDRIKSEIVGGRLAPGARLPTEQDMMLAMKVSRTVVREAVAALRAQGLVVTRQGSGAYVSDAPQQAGFSVDPAMAKSIDAAIDTLELRRAVELESAGLAAERASQRAHRNIRRAHDAFERAAASGQSAAEEDFEFHLAIAQATGNSHFPQFLQYLGQHVIPRQRLAVWGSALAHTADYMAHVRADHAAILAAIVASDGGRARAAMHAHLTRGIARYRRLGKPTRGG